MSPRRTLVGACALAAAALAGCGDTEPASSDVAAGCDGGGETVTVEIPEFTFDPEPVQIGTCDEVVWANTHTQAHTSTGDGDQSWSTGNIAAGDESDPVPFEEPGTFTYICSLHPFMNGTVEVS